MVVKNGVCQAGFKAELNFILFMTIQYGCLRA
ncbi:hypothetical protein EMIT0324P_170081 [Pseudomonas chlororaphis]